jgi:dCMP deaminase
MKKLGPNYFLDLTDKIKLESPCLRNQVGAVLVDNHSDKIVATGVNKPPFGVEPCKDICYRQEHNIPSGSCYEKCKTLHAEQYVCKQIYQYNINVNNCTLYVSSLPCELCCKELIEAGIQLIYYREDPIIHKTDLHMEFLEHFHLIKLK